MSTNAPSEFKGKLFAIFDSKSNFVFWRQYSDCFDGQVLLGETEVNVKFKDIRADQIEALEKAIERERAESQHRINQMLGKIQELRAIEVMHEH